ncbi:hypothetical protein COHA_003231 [Chlorella ohadii]|uniref:Uncharacterized protein n=1 Tax=Chlorella ohadii TaxID=2649997 RepID=A0AAD5DSV2_9CHLO|nr:hypothetical protein COHA_003231 [Chlorella ohadii]
MGRRGGSGAPAKAEADLVDLTQSDGEMEEKSSRRRPMRGRRDSNTAAAAAAASAAAGEPAGARPDRSPAQAAAAAAAAARAGQPLGDLGAAAAAAAAGAPKRRRRSSGDGGGGSGAPAGKKAHKERREDEYGNTVSWRPKASSAVLTRIARAQGGHRLTLPYTVTICRQPNCTCPDAAKGNVCKHVLFVLLRVLHMSPDEPLVWQKALLASEVDEILAGHKSLPRTLGGGEVLAPEAVRQQYRRRASLGGEAGVEGEEGGPLRRSAEGADCPICYERLEVASEKISFCAACGNNCHSACIGEWVKKRRREGAQPTCPLCRAAWVDGTAPAGAAGGAGGEYINLADAAGAPVPTLEQLYGDNAIWIHANQGDISRSMAASMWRNMGH